MEWVGVSVSLPLIAKSLSGQRSLLLKMVYLAAVLLLRTPYSLNEGLDIMLSLHSILRESSDNDGISHDTTGIHLALTVKEHLGADSGDLLYLKGASHHNTALCIPYIPSIDSLLGMQSAFSNF